MNAAILFKRLQGLQGPAPLLTGQIIENLGDGLVQVAQPGGGTQNVRNPPGVPVGQWVFFQSGVITGQAPTRAPVRIEI